MVDIIATVFRFRQLLFEFGPLFLASWLVVAVVFGLSTLLSRHESSLRQQGAASLGMNISGQLYYNMAWMLRLVRGRFDGAPLAGLFIFSLSASIPALVVTSLIDMKAFFLRLILVAVYALFLGWFISHVILRQAGENSAQITGRQDSSQYPISLGTFIRVSWRSFTTQFNEALLPILIGFALASALALYIPAYWLRPLFNEAAWFGPYLAVALAIPFQLSRGAEVPVAVALLIKGASLGTALSVMIASSSTTVSVILGLRRSAGIARVTLYMLVAWLMAGSLGVIVNFAQILLTRGL